MPFQLIRQDITRLSTDAIVNAANSALQAGGGVCGAIFAASDPVRLQKACNALAPCPTGRAVITPGFGLPARYIIHAVGPVWQGGHRGEQALLAGCYTHALQLAVQNGCHSVAFPLISSGIYGVPKAVALQTAVDAIRAFLDENDDDLMVYLVLFDRSAVRLGTQMDADLEQYIDDHYTDPRVERRQCSSSAHSEGLLHGGSFSPQESTLLPPAARPVMAPAPDTAPMPDTAPQPAPKPKRTPGLKWFSRPWQTPQKPAVKKTAPEEAMPADTCEMPAVGAPLPRTLDDAVAHLEDSFSQRLLHQIELRGLSDPQAYKRANVDKKLFSKIRSNAHYQPSKTTVLAFAVALEMNLDDTRDLLASAGYALSRASKGDVIVEFFIRQRRYDIFALNETLFYYDQPLLGAK